MVTQDERADYLTVAEAERRFNEIDRRLGYIEDRVADLTQGQRAINDRLDKVGERIERLEGKFDNRFAKVDERFVRLEDKFDERFAAVDERFARLEDKIDNRFAAVDEKADRNFNILNAKIDEAVAGLYARIAAVEDALRRENRWLFGILLALLLAIFGMLIRLML